jgi:hypothetical protein
MMDPNGGPPPSINLPDGGGASGGSPLDSLLGGGGPSLDATSAGVPGAPDSPKVTDLINQAADLLTQALSQEKDPEDKALIADLVAKAHKFAGSQQSLLDKATGAGPGAKLVRKTTPSNGY